MLRTLLRDPSLMSGHRVRRNENIVSVGDHQFICSSVETAKKLDARLTSAKFAWGMTTRGQAKSRELFDFGDGNGSATGWTQHN